MLLRLNPRDWRTKQKYRKPLEELAVKIRKRYLVQAWGISTTHTLVGLDKEDSEAGNVVAHRPNGDLDYLIFEKELLGSTREDSWFFKTYGIAVNDCHTLPRAQKNVREARAELNGNGLNLQKGLLWSVIAVKPRTLFDLE